MKEAKYVQLRCRDNRIWRVPVVKIARMLEEKGIHIPDLRDHDHILRVAKKLTWLKVESYALAWTDQVPVNYSDEWINQAFEIIEDDKSEDIIVKPQEETHEVEPIKTEETNVKPIKKRTRKRV